VSSFEPYPNASAAPYGPGYGVPVPPRPAQVSTAVRLMYAGGVAQFVLSMLSLVVLSSIKSTIESQSPALDPSQINTLMNVVEGEAVVLAFVYGGLWTWMAVKCNAGRHWARVLSTVFFGLGALSVLISLASSTVSRAPKWDVALGIIPVAIGLFVIILLWRRESSAFFKPALYPPPPFPQDIPPGGFYTP
jgi:hypothetical protein